jgi:hypothetical protein
LAHAFALDVRRLQRLTALALTIAISR